MLASGFRHPFGTGLHTPEFDGDGYYTSQSFDVANGYFQGRHHRAEDWVYEPGNQIYVPLYSPAAGSVIDVGYTWWSGFYAVIKHTLPYTITFDGTTTDIVSTAHFHLNAPARYADGVPIQLGDTLEAGEQFGFMGSTGTTGGLVHNHFEVRLRAVLLDSGYEPGPVDAPWVDPTDFILAHRYMGAVTGTDGAAAISANVGSDLVTGGLGADTLSGAAGDDLLYGNRGADLLFGGDGNDALYGGQGDDRIVGGRGDDTLLGNLGADTMTGGSGADTFHVLDIDTIADFDGVGGDRVAAAAALTSLTDTDDGKLASFDDGSSVALLGVAGGTLSTDRFVIA